MVAGGWERQEWGSLIHGDRASSWGDVNVVNALDAAGLRTSGRRTPCYVDFTSTTREAACCAALVSESFIFTCDFQLKPTLLGETILQKTILRKHTGVSAEVSLPRYF